MAGGWIEGAWMAAWLEGGEQCLDGGCLDEGMKGVGWRGVRLEVPGWRVPEWKQRRAGWKGFGWRAGGWRVFGWREVLDEGRRWRDGWSGHGLGSRGSMSRVGSAVRGFCGSQGWTVPRGSVRGLPERGSG